MNLNFQGLLQSTCSVLGFEVGEIWFARNQPGNYYSLTLLYYYCYYYSLRNKKSIIKISSITYFIYL